MVMVKRDFKHPPPLGINLPHSHHRRTTGSRLFPYAVRIVHPLEALAAAAKHRAVLLFAATLEPRVLHSYTKPNFVSVAVVVVVSIVV